MGHRHWALAAFLGAWLAAAGISAQPIERGNLRLVWRAPPGCPTDREALARIEALLGARVTEILAEPMAARGTVSVIGDGRYELMLETFQGEQRFIRSMQAASCAELTDAGALVLALAIDPKLSERRALAEASASQAAPPPADRAEGTSPATPLAETAVTKQAKPPAPAAPATLLPPPTEKATGSAGGHMRFLVLGAATLDIGSIATAAIGPSLGVALQWKTVEASIGALWLPPRRSYAAPEKGGDITLATGFIRGCYRPLRNEWEVLTCGTFEVGVISGKGAGTVEQFDPSGAWIAPGVLISARRRLGSNFLVSLGGGVQIPIQPVDFTLENVGLVHSVPALVPRVELGAGGFFD